MYTPLTAELLIVRYKSFPPKLRPYRSLTRDLRRWSHEQLIPNGERFKPAFAERDKKQTMTDLRGISKNWLKNQLCPFTRLSRLRALDSEGTFLGGNYSTIVMKNY